MRKIVWIVLVGLFISNVCMRSEEKGTRYYLTEAVYTDKDEATNTSIRIHYPQIHNMKNKGAEKMLNAFIESSALEVLGDFTGFDDMDINVSYAVTCASPSVFSLYFVATSFHSAQAYPLIRISTASFLMEAGNIGIRINLTEIIDIDDSFINSFFDNFHFYSKYNSPDYENTVNKYVAEIISKEDFLRCDNGLGSTIHSYLTEESLFIAIAVPHSIGSYVLYTARYSDIMELIRPEIRDQMGIS